MKRDNIYTAAAKGAIGGGLVGGTVGGMKAYRRYKDLKNTGASDDELKKAKVSIYKNAAKGALAAAAGTGATMAGLNAATRGGVRGLRELKVTPDD